MSKPRGNLKKVAAWIKRNKRFLITTHTNLEGDALGSELAFYRLLKKMGKEVVMLNQDIAPPNYNFLPGANLIQRYNPHLKNIQFDSLVVVDCSDLTRTGEVYKINKENKPILNIDHHISNENFGSLNWVDTAASSCAEMIYSLYKTLAIPLDRQAALCLYVGLLTDTGSFRYTNTSAFTHQAASVLLKYNLGIQKIYQSIYENIPFSEMELLVRILPTIKRKFAGKVAWFEIKQNLLKGKKLSFDLTEHILSFARAIKDVEVAVLFKENLGVKDEIRVNFRSQGKVNVNRIAFFFGGGGHKTASGATVQGKMETVKRRVLARIKENLASSPCK